MRKHFIYIHHEEKNLRRNSFCYGTFASRITRPLLAHCKQHFNLAKILLSAVLGMGGLGQCDAENNTLE